MDHNHVLVDQDGVFSIEVDSREIVLFDSGGTEVVDPVLLVQGDHNSERFTFEIPRTIESHDMSLCNKVQVHYLNIGRNGEQSPGIYDVPAEDLFVDPEDDTVVICSWLISDVATKYEGTLNFAIRYACYTEGSNKPEYAFNTKPYTNVIIAAGLNNAGAVVERYGDILESWYQKFIDAEDSSLSEITEAKETSLTAITEAKETSLTAITEAKEASITAITETKDSGVSAINSHVENASKPDIAAYVEEQKETFVSDAADSMRTEILNEFDERVIALENKNVEQVVTVNGKTLKFFVGETSEYKDYEEMDDLLALLTDDTSKDDLITAINDLETVKQTVADFETVQQTVIGLIEGTQSVMKATMATRAEADSAGNKISDVYTQRSEFAETGNLTVARATYASSAYTAEYVKLPDGIDVTFSANQMNKETAELGFGWYLVTCNKWANPCVIWLKGGTTYSSIAFKNGKIVALKCEYSSPSNFTFTRVWGNNTAWEEYSEGSEAETFTFRQIVKPSAI